MTVTDNAIRIQLPGGDMYAPAFDEAASRTGARSGLAAKHATSLKQLVAASVAVLNSGDASTITLHMIVHEDSIAVEVVGKGFSSPTKRLVKKLETLADKKASTFETTSKASTHTISFAT